ncbi:RNA-directed DNA polymerase [Acinetobacter baumannii]|uniref:RNA-directed DNA polymerase n=1 Tax=Acinetobacter baumannii TaxID=470 RepID=UPI000B106EB1|nr:RNA-directed DNA polymerase [Acinetobacter baumannii]MCA4215510.1 RNA-directed DNA polymerase [Acinetobacter baumannii]MCO0802256.1 RNA-directed DNA polymerase [Acinetobacter baumannii]MCO4227849.1 RNA-directed DNA polymerase [Acinetobacter baumannii]MCO4246647.1 RNA-directed DNA polymerase [Acinetobacter baumannii]MCO4266644.1 RNA-directed DNA polymerase [Acinetobacter baumannii]
MTYKASFTGWENLKIEDLLVAYRKAKADCFFENTFPTAVKFAEYEQNLLTNLKSFLKKLRNENGFIENSKLLGNYRVVPKKLSIDRKNIEGYAGHIHFSDPKKNLNKLFSENVVEPSFRLIGDFPVETHLISALWINMIGEQFDERLGESCYAARLKRIKNNEDFTLDTRKPFHLSAIGSFSPYFQPYQKWRNDGLNAIRDELEKDRSVIAVSLDLKSYYHYIDPKIIVSNKLHESFNIILNHHELLFTKQLAIFLEKWGNGAVEYSKNISFECEIPGGLAIGLTASRIISNMILHRWDKLIKEKVTPIHYGRYVDDMFLVLKDTGNIENSDQLMEFLRERIGGDVLTQDNNDSKKWYINLPNSLEDKTSIQLQADKQKLFLLDGQLGLDLLDSIEKDIYELSSEHRLMPSPDQLDQSTAAKVLSAAGSVGENADTLRRADGLTIRRLSWALQLRHVETLARDLPPKVWQKQRNEFYQFAHNHILRPDSIFEHFTYLPRLLGFAISLNEWHQAELIVLRSYNSLDILKAEIFNQDRSGPYGEINGAKCILHEEIWQEIKYSLTVLFIDAATKYYDPNALFGEEEPKQKSLEEIFFRGLFGSIDSISDFLNTDLSITNFKEKALLVVKSDLGKNPYKQILKLDICDKLIDINHRVANEELFDEFQKSDLVFSQFLRDFLKSSFKERFKKIKDEDKYNFELFLPYLFPTRPYSPAEISELAPECVGLPKNNKKFCKIKPTKIWARYCQAVRGIWIKPTLLATENDNSDKVNCSRSLRIGTDSKNQVIVALTNLKTSEQDWAYSAVNKPNLSLERYQRIADLVNDILRLKPRPDYVFFPELSIPLEWVDSIASRLCNAGISIIAGTEYRHTANDKLISEALLILSDNRLGYYTWQSKT